MNGEDSGSIPPKQAVSNKVINPGLLFNLLFLFKSFWFYIFYLKYLALNLLRSGGCCSCCSPGAIICITMCCPCLGDLINPILIGK